MAKKSTQPTIAPNLLEQILNGSALTENFTHRFTCRLMTPLYGGGVKAGNVDSSQPVRPSAIRGQLRYWWRIANRHRFRGSDGKLDAKLFFKAEREIWGGLGGADDLAKSNIIVRVEDVKGFNQIAPAAKYEKKGDTFRTYPLWEKWAGGDEMGYALFPTQGKASKQGVTEQPKALVKPGKENIFHLSVGLSPQALHQHEDHRKRWLVEAETAVRWWAHFGGLGARSRRGLGAVLVEESHGVPLSMPTEDVLQQAGVRLVMGKSHPDAVSALSGVIGAYRELRQGSGKGRNPGSNSNKPGRSRWPEPDAIRRITNAWNPNHKPEHPAGNLYPRALFGLPIVFHFQGGGDPSDSTLEPSLGDSNRMASPVILRPISADGKTWYEGCLIVEPDVVKAMPSLKIKIAGGRSVDNLKAWPSGKQDQQRVVGQIKPLIDCQNAQDPIQALANHIRARGAGNQIAAMQEQAQAVEEASKPRVLIARAQYSRSNGSLSFEPSDKNEKVDILLKDQADAIIETVEPKSRQKLTSGEKYKAKWELTVQGKTVVAIKESVK